MLLSVTLIVTQVPVNISGCFQLKCEGTEIRDCFYFYKCLLMSQGIKEKEGGRGGKEEIYNVSKELVPF